MCVFRINKSGVWHLCKGENAKRCQFDGANKTTGDKDGLEVKPLSNPIVPGFVWPCFELCCLVCRTVLPCCCYHSKHNKPIFALLTEFHVFDRKRGQELKDRLNMFQWPQMFLNLSHSTTLLCSIYVLRPSACLLFTHSWIDWQSRGRMPAEDLEVPLLYVEEMWWKRPDVTASVWCCCAQPCMVHCPGNSTKFRPRSLGNVMQKITRVETRTWETRSVPKFNSSLERNQENSKFVICLLFDVDIWRNRRTPILFKVIKLILECGFVKRMKKENGITWPGVTINHGPSDAEADAELTKQECNSDAGTSFSGELKWVFFPPQLMPWRCLLCLLSFNVLVVLVS